MGYSVDFISFDCYSDTTVLINKFGIRDEEKSNEVEGVITSARYTKWLSAPEVKDFDFAYYKEIHRFLLSVKEVAGFNERFLTHTETHTGKRADKNNGEDRTYLP